MQGLLLLRQQHHQSNESNTYVELEEHRTGRGAAPFPQVEEDFHTAGCAYYQLLQEPQHAARIEWLVELTQPVKNISQAQQVVRLNIFFGFFELRRAGGLTTTSQLLQEPRFSLCAWWDVCASRQDQSEAEGEDPARKHIILGQSSRILVDKLWAAIFHRDMP